MILSKSGKPSAKMYYEWLMNPSSNTLLVPINSDLIGDMEVYNQFGVDCVDGALLKLAQDIGKKCGVQCTIATYDTRDFYTLWSQYDAATFKLCDMKEDYTDLL